MSSADAVDLVVCGAGGGLVGALRAAELGLSVLLVEKNPHFAAGNNTAMSTAMVPGAGTRWQRAAGIDDSAAAFLADVERKTAGTADPDVAAALTEVSARLVEWLADSAGIELDLVVDFDYPGHSRSRCHTVHDRSGRTLIAGLWARVAAHPGIDVMQRAEVTAVGPLRDGVRELALETPAGTQAVPARAVLLATSGFAARPSEVRVHAPEIADAVYHGSEEATGTALRIGEALGADTRQLDAYQGHAALALPGATLVGWATVMNGGFLVDGAGRRFGDETTGYSEYAAVVQREAGGRAWLVLDRRIHEACLVFRDYRETVESGAIHWSSGVAALARRTGIDEAGLAATLAHARACAAGRDSDPYGRVGWGEPLSDELGAVAVSPALFHTQGGLRVDRGAAVLDPDGRRIDGVYASGGAAVGMSGSGAGGYLAGNGLLAALGLALLAAEDAAEALR